MGAKGKVRCHGCDRKCWVGWADVTVLVKGGRFVKNDCKSIQPKP